MPDEGEILLDGQPITMKTPIDARAYGIETVYQTLAVSPSLDIADNLFLGREPRAPGIMGKVFRKLDSGKMRAEAKKQMTELGIMTIQDINQQVESLSGGQRQGVAVARAAAFGSKVIILDEPTAALGVKESAHVLELILKVRDKGIPVILISHNMPHVFEVADRIHIHRLGRRIAVVTPKIAHHERGRGDHDRRHRARARSATSRSSRTPSARIPATPPRPSSPRRSGDRGPPSTGEASCPLIRTTGRWW